MRLLAAASTVIIVALGTLALTSASPARAAGIGFLPGSAGFDGSIENADGSPDVQAGSHPYQVTNGFDLQTIPDVNGSVVVAGGNLKDFQVDAPPGLIGDINAVPICSEVEFYSQRGCADDTVVGVLHVRLGNARPKDLYVPVYNLQPTAGAPAVFGANVGGGTFFVASVRSESDYGISVSVRDVSQLIAPTGGTLTLWGVPADPSHDTLRGRCLTENIGAASLRSCPSGVPPKPYLTLPTSCMGPLPFSIVADSWASPGLFATDGFLSHDSSGNPIGLQGCDRLALTPEVAVSPTVDQASTATGLDFRIDIADEGLTAPEGLAEPQIKKTVVTLPEGVTVNPSAGEGLGACMPSDYHRETAASASGTGCPNSSKLGEVTIESPLLEKPINGSLFIAQPDDPATSTPGAENPFDSLLAIYIVAKEPERGIVIKAAGKIEPDPVTGRLTTTFDNLPQLPFAHFKLHFREGQSAPLVSPPACGTYTTQASFVPWSAADPNNPSPEEIIHKTSSFTITKGVHEGPCPSGGVPPFHPQVISGTQNNAAGSYSPFYLRIVREDGEQEITKFTTVLSPGLTGNLTGIPFCPDSTIEAARLVSGRQELSEPSCPASEIGHTTVGAGVGTVLAQTPGKVYLAGPYHGSALSIVSITSATVGPFDLGTVVIRFALRINPTTAQVEVDSTGSDPIPHIIKGIVVHVRDIRVYMNRPRFILNPTSCAAMSISNTITGTGADPANPADQAPVSITSPFQAADCASLGFKPAFKVSTSGRTSRSKGASLSVKLTYPNAPFGSQSNIGSVKVNLPKQLPSRLTTLQKACPDSTFNANPAACGTASRVGTATAYTPILPVPLEGPAYFVSHGGAKFPELIVVLQGYGITIDLHGETFISKAGITSSTFHTVPDQPVTSFQLTLPQGPYSALAANGNLCKSKLAIPTAFTAQNGKTIHQSTKITVTGCPTPKTTKTNKPPKH
jgi:hypothetical protein